MLGFREDRGRVREHRVLGELERDGGAARQLAPGASLTITFDHQRLGLRLCASGIGLQAWHSGFRVQGAGCRVQGSGFRVWGVGLTSAGAARTPPRPPRTPPLLCGLRVEG